MDELPAERPPAAVAARTEVLLAPSRVMLITVANVTLLGLLPCLGALNWLLVPLALATAGVGAAGLWLDRDEQGHLRRPGPYMAAVVGGGLLSALTGLRLLLGFGLW